MKDYNGINNKVNLPSRFNNKARKRDIPESKGYIVFDPELCTGCQTCELACSAIKCNGNFQPSLSRIQIKNNPFGETVNNYEPIMRNSLKTNL